ncbi:MAG: ATP-binding protein [Myxococcota bacterium]|nr:FHA domain-containing protein [Deltaproteobacteria bacterium]MDQ3333605.1 ATP-binding protein [Myxococcota bacterium]
MSEPARTDDLRAETVPIAIEDDPTGPIAVPAGRLLCLVGVDMGRMFEISGPVVVGRGSSGIDVRSSDVSRNHARLWRDGGSVFVEDLGSSNGTLVNGTVVMGPVEIRLGDRVQFGSAIFVFTRHDELEERVQQLQKLDAMGALVKGLAHDFNNMLTVLQVGLEELREAPVAFDADARRTMDDMTTATTSAAGLIRRLLRIGRAKPPTTELVKLSRVVDETIAMARAKVGRVRLHAQVTADARVMGSFEELKQVFFNLIINARDAMPSGGEISINANITTLDRASALSLHLEQEGSYVDISVSDTGCGMDDATRARIFEPFYTTKPVGKGSGLGLAMVYSSVRNHRGAVYAESIQGRGTTFRILLPAI